MGLRSIGGGQFRQVVEELIQIEREPVRQLEARKAKEDVRLKTFQQFKSKVSDLKTNLDAISDFKKLQELKVDLGSGENLVGVTLDNEKAQPGTYEITIDELAQGSSIISNGFEDPDKPVVGTGYILMFMQDGETVEVPIENNYSSLNGIARAINHVQNSPVQATVIQDHYDEDSPWRLIVTAKKDGQVNEIDFPEFYFLGGEHSFYIDDEREAQNAYLTMNGFEIEAEGNKIENFIQGVNLQLQEARPDAPFTMTISVDNEKVVGKVKDVVDKINGVLKFINQQNKVDENTDTSTTFAGDTGLQSIEYRIRNLLHEAFPVGDVESGNYTLGRLHDIGIEFSREGELTFDENKFKKETDGNFNRVADIVSGEHGFINQFREVVSLYARPFDGLLARREEGLRQRIRSIDTQIENKERLLDQRSKALKERFARLESSLGALQSQQQYVNATLGGGGNPITQLLG